MEITTISNYIFQISQWDCKTHTEDWFNQKGIPLLLPTKFGDKFFFIIIILIRRNWLKLVIFDNPSRLEELMRLIILFLNSFKLMAATKTCKERMPEGLYFGLKRKGLGTLLCVGLGKECGCGDNMNRKKREDEGVGSTWEKKYHVTRQPAVKGKGLCNSYIRMCTDVTVVLLVE